MENDIEKLKFPIGKYKAILEFNFSRTVEDIKIGRAHVRTPVTSLSRMPSSA